jgi:hypothetical protein
MRKRLGRSTTSASFAGDLAGPGPGAFRAWLLDFQLENKLEDAQIRWLNWSRSLKAGQTGLHVDGSLFVAVYGGACIVALWLVYGASLLKVAHASDYSARSVLLSAAVVFLVLAMSRGVWLFYVLPRRISTALALRESRRGSRGLERSAHSCTDVPSQITGIVGCDTAYS